MSQRISGAILSYVLLAVKLLVTLFYTPILVSSLGQEGYGLFSIVGAMAAYLYLLDFGINDSVLRFFVQHENDPNERNVFLGRMLSFYGLIGILVITVTLILSTFFTPVFSKTLTLEQQQLLRNMLLVTGIGAGILLAFNPISALLSAAEKFVFLRCLEIIISISTAVVIVFLLSLGYRELMVVSVMSGSVIVQVVLRAIYASKVLGVRLVYYRPLSSDIKRVGGYALPIFVVMAAETIFWKLDHIMIGALIGAAPVAIYAIGVTFNKYFMSFGTAVSRPLTPQIIRTIDAGSDAITLTEMMVRISRVQAMALLLVLGGLIVFGQQFLTLWLGEGYELSYYVMLMVLCPYALEVSGNVRNIVLQVKELYWYRSLILFSMAFVNIPLTLWFLKLWGAVGAALSTGLAILGGYILIALILKRFVGIALGRYWFGTFGSILPAFFVILVLAFLWRQYLPESWLGLLCGAVAFTTLYLVTLVLFVMNGYEKQLCRRVMAKFGLKRTAVQ